MDLELVIATWLVGKTTEGWTTERLRVPDVSENSYSVAHVIEGTAADATALRKRLEKAEKREKEPVK